MGIVFSRFLAWVLDVPCRNDIVVLAPHRTTKVSSAHFGMGDVIFREGDAADCVYVINSGAEEVYRDSNGGQKTLTVSQIGDCFGEIALLSDSSRTATVKCPTAVDLTVSPHDQFLALAEGYRELRDALRSSTTERMARHRGIWIATPDRSALRRCPRGC